jgi:hypothetical protein
MTWGMVAVAGATLVGSYMNSQAQKNAAQTQANAALQQQSNLLAAGQTASQQFNPYATYGATPLASLTANNPYFNTQFSNADLNANLAPNYAWSLDQGTRATNAASNATGGMVGGNALQALNTFNQNYAQTAYQNAFNNYQTQRGNIGALDLANANLGLSGATGSANAQLGTATNVANLGIGSANAQAAAQIAQGNIYGNAANTLGNLGYMYANQNNQQQTPSSWNTTGNVNSGVQYQGNAPGTQYGVDYQTS